MFLKVLTGMESKRDMTDKNKIRTWIRKTVFMGEPIPDDRRDIAEVLYVAEVFLPQERFLGKRKLREAVRAWYEEHGEGEYERPGIGDVVTRENFPNLMEFMNLVIEATAPEPSSGARGKPGWADRDRKKAVV